jgi:hypothetical protein
MRLARPIAGDGRAATTWELATDRGCASRDPPPTAW